MSTNTETTKTLRGRHTKTPMKFQHNGSLGAAVGGCLLHSTHRLLPGFAGAADSTAVGDAATNSQSEAAADGAATSAPAKSGQGKAPARAAADPQQVSAILANPCFAVADACAALSDDSEAGGSDIAVENGGDDSKDVSDSNEDAEDEDGTLEQRSAGAQGRGSDGRISQASAGSVPRATSPTPEKQLATLRKSIDRHRTKSYENWPASLLREACRLRKIGGQSKCNDPQKMARVLEDLDRLKERTSPFLLDLEDKATGGTPASKPPASAKECETIPESLIKAVSAALDLGTSFDKGKLPPPGGKSYPVEAVLAVIRERKRAEAGGGDGVTGGRRKSKHCVPRFCELVAQNLGEWFGHRTQLSKAELDKKLSSKTRPAMLNLWDKFKDATHRVPFTFADDERVVAANIDPNIVHQPNITFDKFMGMKNDLIKDHGDMVANYKKSGSHAEMFSFCKDKLDTYYYGLMCEKYPGIEQATTCMLPDGKGSESTGVGGGTNGPSGVEGAAADASRRKAAKEDSRTRNAALGGQDKKKRKQEEEIENVAKVAAKSAEEELGLGEGGLGSLLGVSSSTQYADAPNSFFATIAGLETTAKKFEVQAKLRQELKDIKASIREEKALGEEADPEDLEILERQLKDVRAALNNKV